MKNKQFKSLTEIPNKLFNSVMRELKKTRATHLLYTDDQVLFLMFCNLRQKMEKLVNEYKKES